MKAPAFATGSSVEAFVAAIAERVGSGAFQYGAVQQRGARFSALVVIGPLGPRETTRRLIRGLGAHEVVPAGTLADARVRADVLGPHALCVTDAILPDGSGLDLIQELTKRGWQRGLVLSMSDDAYSVRAALSAGVRSFVVTGRSSHGGFGTGGVASSLTEREIEILRYVSSGRSNKEIATLLGLSALTVKSHLARISRKMGTGDRAELVMHALRAGVIQ
ncbi:MAG: response regulator transcription factor [Actinomycetota bacterium]